MAGLYCGAPTREGWPTLLAGLGRAAAVSDIDTARAAHNLVELGVNAGPCGASQKGCS